MNDRIAIEAERGNLMANAIERFVPNNDNIRNVVVEYNAEVNVAPQPIDENIRVNPRYFFININFLKKNGR